MTRSKYLHSLAVIFVTLCVVGNAHAALKTQNVADSSSAAKIQPSSANKITPELPKKGDQIGENAPSDVVTPVMPSLAADNVVDYFPVFPPTAAPDAVPEFIPVAANHPLKIQHPGITRGILFIHDADRNASQNLALLNTLAGMTNDTTMIVAPQFLLESDIALYADKLPQKGRMFSRWALGTWERGGDAQAVTSGQGVNAFSVADLILLFMTDKNSFPDMQQIVVVGLGAGGDFVQRYAAVGRAADLINPPQDKNASGLSVRYVVADASSYLYMTNTRYLGPKQGFGIPDTNACPDYNMWPNGLDGLTSYARRTGVNSAKINFANRFITYLNSASSVTDTATSTCGMQVQGGSPLDRAKIYAFYLKSIYGTSAEQKQTFVTMTKAGHDAATLFGSACGMSLLFGDGFTNCSENP